MKINFIKIFILSLLFPINSIFSQNTNTNHTQPINTEDIATFCKVWGFLKYFHPNVADGINNWDEKFIKQLTLLENTKNKEERTLFYLNWINSLGTVKKCKPCNDAIDESQYFLKNMDFAWLESISVFDVETVSKLLDIKNNRYQKKTYYMTEGVRGQIEFINESSSVIEAYPDVQNRILALAKYWNSVEYFSPYKYLVDINWNQVLKERLPDFMNASDSASYDLAKLQSVIQTDDGHAYFHSVNTSYFLGIFFFPADLKIIGGNAIITYFPNPTLAVANGLEIGDIIVKSNNESIMEVINKRLKYINGSNMNAKLRYDNLYLLNGATDSVAVLISRKGKLINKKVARYQAQFVYNNPQISAKYKILQKRIGYINMSSMQKEDVNQAMKEFENLPGIIIDLRNYPNFLPFEIASRFIKEKKNFAVLTEPDLSFPSRFKFGKMKTVKPEGQYYNRKVIILVNERTQSRGEFSAMLLQVGDNVKTVGSKTAGADGDIASFYFSSNSKSTLSSLGVYYPDKTETQRIGVKIDVEVKETIFGIQSGKDEILEEAIKQIDKF